MLAITIIGVYHTVCLFVCLSIYSHLEQRDLLLYQLLVIEDQEDLMVIGDQKDLMDSQDMLDQREREDTG